MFSKELFAFIKEQDDYLKSLNTIEVDDEKNIYWQLVKLSEEVGELNEAVLAKFGHQRKAKDKPYDIGAEIADVILVSLILARRLNIDIDSAFKAKVNKIIGRR